MDLFLETPQQQAERMLRQQQRLMEMQMQGAAAQPFAQNVVPAAVPAAVPGCESAPEAYSVQQDSYAQELAFDKRRARRRRLGQRLRTLAMIVGLRPSFWRRMPSRASSTAHRPTRCSNICQPSASA